MTDAMSEPPWHGGDLFSASRRYGIPVEEWLDLSTGISPFSYPTGDIPPSAYQRLPYSDPQLPECAASYYGNNQLLAVPGSQPVIQLLPKLLPEAPLLAPALGYQEYVLQWRRVGGQIDTYPSMNLTETKAFLDQALAQNNRCHLLIINPNNPTGLRFSPDQLQNWAGRLAKDCYLIVDEAFIDTHPGQSVLPDHFDDSMIVLRSFGKFFGLAGVRLGFVFAKAEIRAAIENAIGIWALNGPAQSIAIKALDDIEWQKSAHERIREAAEWGRQQLEPLMNSLDVSWSVHAPLFSSYRLPAPMALELQAFYARQGVLVRSILMDQNHSLLRIGRLDPDDVWATLKFQRANLSLTRGANTSNDNL